MYNSSAVTRWVLGPNRWVVHGLFWLGWAMVLAIFFFDVVLGQIQGWGEFVIYLTMHMGVFYFASYRMAPVVFKRRSQVWWRLALYPTGTLAMLTVVITAMSAALGGLRVTWSPGTISRVLVSNFWSVVLPFVPGLVTGLLFYGIRWGIMQSVALLKVRKFSDGLSQSLAASRQSALFVRVLPHLLFNLLPVLHRIVIVNYDRFGEAFDQTSDMLKFFARLPAGGRIPAWEELRQVHKLIGLRELATGRKINIRWELDDRLSELTVFPMSIFMPVENALKYAITARRDTPVVVRIMRYEEMVVVTIENVVNPHAIGNRVGLGMGLNNLREQLDILTDAQFTLETTEENGRFGVVIRYPEAHTVLR